MIIQAFAMAFLVIAAVVTGLLGLAALAMGEFFYGIGCLVAAGVAMYIANKIDRS